MFRIPTTHRLPYREQTIRNLAREPGEYLKFMKKFILSLQDMYDEIANAINGNAAAYSGVREATDLDATPDVERATFLVLNYSSNTTVTDFDEGESGQMLHILKTSGAGTVTIADNANIATNTGANKNMVTDKVQTFRNYSGVWYEVE
jgi:hypothetical protein